MNFTYESYENLIKLLIENGYVIANYHNYEQYEKCAILRHDIDMSIDKAVSFARLEERIGVRSTYFVLTTSDFYNVNSMRSVEGLKEIIKCGGTIGLHFDQVRYPELEDDYHKMCGKIIKEKEYLENILNIGVNSVSMHRPSKNMLNRNLVIPNMINTYGDVFFREFKYLSDSRYHWRENPEEIIESGTYNRLQILTHASSYSVNEKSVHDALEEFVNRAKVDRYEYLNENFTNLQQVLLLQEVLQ